MKIKIYFGKNNGENVEIFENVTDGKVIVLNGGSTGKIGNVDLYSDNVIDDLKKFNNELLKNNEMNSFYCISDEIYDQNVLNEFELTLITEYTE